MCVQYESFENTVGKEEIARNEQFLLFPQSLKILVANFLSWKSLKFVVWEMVKKHPFTLQPHSFHLKKKNKIAAANLQTLKSQWRPTRKAFVYKIQVNPIHAILKYGNYYDFMDR